MSIAVAFIDPGYSSGAIAILVGNEPPWLIDLNLRDDFCGTIRTIGGIINSLRSQGHEIVAGIEKVSAAPRQKGPSAFSFGGGYYALQAVLCAWSVPFSLVSPQRWQEVIDSSHRKTPRIRRDKDLLDAESADKEYAKRRTMVKAAAWNFAKRMFPTAELKTKTDHQDRADALCGALWLSKQR